jgi:glycosyltransferase involved in cell wall biosynthesis
MTLARRRPRVVFVCPNLAAGGAERQWAALVPGLAECGFDVRVITLDGHGVHFADLRARGVPVACARLRHRADPIGLARVVRLAGPRASVVVTRGVSAHLVGQVLARRQRAAHVATEHLGPDPLGLRAYRRHQRLLLGPMRPRVTAVVAVAASQRAHLVRDGYPAGAVRIIPNGVVDDPSLRGREELRAELGVAPGTFLAVLVATLRPEKRATAFVEQVAAAHVAEPSIRGLVVGDGPDAAAVARAAERTHGIVRMAGFRPDALDVMHAADVVCLTSAIEALPMSVLEAMSVARPVVATSVGGIPDVVRHGETGLVIPPARLSEMAGALASLARDADWAAALGRAAQQRQRKEYSIEAMTAGYAALLDAVGR